MCNVSRWLCTQLWGWAPCQGCNPSHSRSHLWRRFASRSRLQAALMRMRCNQCCKVGKSGSFDSDALQWQVSKNAKGTQRLRRKHDDRVRLIEREWKKLQDGFKVHQGVWKAVWDYRVWAGKWMKIEMLHCDGYLLGTRYRLIYGCFAVFQVYGCLCSFRLWLVGRG